MAKVPKFLRLHRNSLRLWLVVVGLAAMRFSATWFAIGAALAVGGALMRLWAKAYLTQRERLTTSGPYAMSRNPFYLGNLLLDLGICLMIGRIEVLAAYLAVWTLFHYRKILSEERALEAQWGEVYRAYKRQVPRLLPWRVSNLARMWRSRHEGSWASRNFTRGIEIPRFLAAISYPLLFFCWHRLRAEGLALLEGRHTLDFTLLCALLCLQLLARAMRRPLRKRRPVVPRVLSSAPGRTAFVLCFLGLVFLLRFAEMEADPMVFLAGLAATAVLLSVATARSVDPDSPAAMAFELGACALGAVLAEVPWALFAPVFFYTLVAFQRFVLGSPPALSPGPPLHLGRWRAAALIVLATSLGLLKELIEHS
ncbi:MAG: methyltransferase family protein [Candidatus Brocadiia bacterium]